MTDTKEPVLRALDLKPGQLILLRQGHSNRVIAANAIPSGDSEPRVLGPADGVITVAEAQFPVLRTADCLPILVVLPEQRRVCAVHAGWRGTRDRITFRAVHHFLQLNQKPASKLIAAIGPCIHSCCYEVGEEVRDQYQEAGHDVNRLFSGRHLDLVEANREQLGELGVVRILESQYCTACRVDLFYSHRREGRTGRHWAVAGFRRS